MIHPVVLSTVAYRHMRVWQRMGVKLPGQRTSLIDAGIVRGQRHCQHQSGVRARLDGMVSECELLRNIVIFNKPKVLLGLNQNGKRVVIGVAGTDAQTKIPPVKRQDLNHLSVTQAEQVKPVYLPAGESLLQERPMGVQV